jgi:putative transcriptional regulator
MPRKIADRLGNGFGQTMTVAGSVTQASVYAVHIPAEIDVKAIRVRLGLTQQEFAFRFGFSVNTLRHWEQGRRVPEAPTRAYLLVIDREPQAVEKALRIP